MLEDNEVFVLIGAKPVDAKTAVGKMEPNLRQEVYFNLYPCTPQEFIDAYMDHHKEKFGEEFTINE